MSAANKVASWYDGFRIAILVLIAGNTLWFVVAGPWSKGLDSLAWYVLLLLFVLETGYPRWLDKKHALRTVHALRLCAAAGVATSMLGYLDEHDWLDAINIGLWILVVALLECELRYPHVVARRRRWFKTTAVVLYAGIAALVPLWALRGEWFDSYDAVLWLVAFWFIEMDVLKLAR